MLLNNRFKVPLKLNFVFRLYFNIKRSFTLHPGGENSITFVKSDTTSFCMKRVKGFLFLKKRMDIYVYREVFHI